MKLYLFLLPTLSQAFMMPRFGAAPSSHPHMATPTQDNNNKNPFSEFADFKAPDLKTPDFGNLMDNAKGMVSNCDISRFTDNLGEIKDNVLSGELGERGEAYVAAQFSLVALVAFGYLPLEQIMNFLLGPGALLGGLATMVLSVLELGPNLSPWPVANDDSELVASGPFAYVRHPIYAGLLAACLALLVLVPRVAVRV